MNRFRRICCAAVVGLPISFGGTWSLAAELNAPVRTGGVSRSLATPLHEGYAPAQRPHRPATAPARRLPEVDSTETRYLRARDTMASGLADANLSRDGARPLRAADADSNSKMEKLPAVDPSDESISRGPSQRLPQESALNLLAPQAAAPAELRSVLKRPSEVAVYSPNALQNPAIANVAAHADALARHGMSLAGRGAYFSARSEFIQALRLIAQALDQESPGTQHGQQLAAGLRALEEAKDFVPPGSQLEADLDLASIVAAHQTPVLKHAGLTPTNTLAALQDYYTYAQEQLASASGHEPAASLALFGLGKIHLLLAGQTTPTSRLEQPKAMVFHRAALLVDPANFRAANELGVLLAKCGQLEAAKEVLQQSALTSPQAEAWHNLAVVHERLGETAQAQQARREWQLLSSGVAARRTPVNDAPVQWLDPKQFASVSAGQEQGARPPIPNGSTAQQPPGVTSPARQPPPPWLRPNWQTARPRGQY